MKSILIHSGQSLHYPKGGGSGRLMRQLALALHQSDWYVKIICPSPNNDNQLLDHTLPVDFSTYSYGTPTTGAGRFYRSFTGSKELRKTVNSQNFDIILDNADPIPYYPLHYLCPEDVVNAIFVHVILQKISESVFDFPKSNLVQYIEKSLAFLNNPTLITNGPSTKKRIADMDHSLETHVLRPSVDLDKFNYNFDPTSKKILYLGRLAPIKNISCLLRAWSTIEGNHEGVDLVIAGTGTMGDELTELANNLKLENVKFVGYTDGKEKFRLLEESLALVFPSLIEGYGMVGLEALASGTIVIGSNVPGISDYISHNRSGFLFKSNNHNSLATNIDYVLRNPNELHSVAEEGYEVAKQHSFDAFRSESNRIFTELSRKSSTL